MKIEEEKVIMEVTKGEAMFILRDRLDNNWKSDLMPVFILGPTIIIAYFIYELLDTRLCIYLALTPSILIIAAGVTLLFGSFKKQNKVAERLYQEMKANRE